MWSLHKIKLMADDKILSYCQENLDFIGEGTGRQVFAISNDLVIKIAYNIAGRRQSELESRLQESDICATIHQHHKEYLWSIMDRLTPYEDNGDLEHITASTFHDRMVWCEYHQMIEMDSIPKEFMEKVKERYDNKVSGEGEEWIVRMRESSHVNNLLNFIINNKMEAGDLTRTDAWGYVNGDKDKPMVFDYGLSSKVWQECYTRRNVDIKYNDGRATVRLVEVIDQQAKVGDMVKVWINGKPDMFEVID